MNDMNTGTGKTLTAALVRVEGDEALYLRSPAVGLWRGAPQVGTPLAPGMAIGAIEVLGVLHPLTLPPGAAGVVRPHPDPAVIEAGAARRPVAYDELLLALEPGGLALAAADDGAEEAHVREGRYAVRAPSSGRYYGRPSPDRAPFVQVGDELRPGVAVGLLEVMKTFTRIQYGGPGQPARARVTALLVEDGADVEAGAPLVELEPLG